MWKIYEEYDYFIKAKYLHEGKFVSLWKSSLVR